MAGFKPAESGCLFKDGHYKRADSLHLKKMAAMPESLDLVNPYYFDEPLAPGIAANRAHQKISINKIKKNISILHKKYDAVLVEGAGGLLVPFAGKKTNLDLIVELKASVIVVGRLGLGTINHTLLTLDKLKQKKIKILGVILNDTNGGPHSISEKTNAAILKKMGVHLLGVFPHLSKKQVSHPKALIRALQGFLLS